MTVERLVGRPSEPTTKIKPSQAMRLGALVSPVQAFGIDAETDGSSCAMGAMYYGYGLSPVDGGFSGGGAGGLGIEEAWDAVYLPKCPALAVEHALRWCQQLQTLTEAVVHLNDDHRWTRERIADFVETQGY